MISGTSLQSIHGALPPLSDAGEPNSFENTQNRLSDESFFERMMKRNNSMAMHLAFEPLLRQMFHADRSIVWNVNMENDHFYSPTLNKTLVGSDSLIAATARAMTSINCIFIDNKISLDQLCVDPFTPNLFIPLYLRTGNVVVAVCQLTRNAGSKPFGDFEMNQSFFITKKFLIYGTCTLNTPHTISLASEIARVLPSSKCIENLTKSLTNSFLCKTVDFWIYRPKSNTFAKFDQNSDSFIVVPAINVGIVNHALRARQFINERASKYHVNYLKEADGDPDQPIIVGQDEFEDQIYAVALRGRTVDSPFSIDDDKRIILVMPFVSRSISFSFGFSERDEPEGNNIKNHLTSILDIAANMTEITNLLDLIIKIQDSATKLVSCETAKLLIVNEFFKEFQYDFGVDLNEHKRSPLDKGLAGQVYSLEESLRSDDPKNEENFDIELDDYLGSVPENILIVPIFSSTDKVIAVIELQNKLDSDSFNQKDEDTIVAFAVFCGISLQNSFSYIISRKIQKQIQKFSGLTKNILNQDSIEQILQLFLSTGKEVVHAYRVSLFLLNNENLFEYMTVGRMTSQNVPLNFAQNSVSKKKMMTFKVNNVLTDENNSSNLTNSMNSSRNNDEISQTSKLSFNSSLNKNLGLLTHSNTNVNETAHSSVRSYIFSSRPTDSYNSAVCCSPLVSSDRAILGVIEICCELSGSSSEIELIESFSMIISMFIEKSLLKEMTILGKEFVELHQTLNVLDHKSYDVPNSFCSIVPTLYTLAFDARRVGSIELTKVVFTYFNDFKVKKPLQISNETLFYFINKVSNRYNPIKFFNWQHAVSTIQFVAYALKFTEFSLNPEDILCLFVAALCHDLNHDGFIEKRNRNSRNASEILFKYQSVLESHHCQETFLILSQRESNLIKFFDQEKRMYFYKTVKDLILITDMAHHFDFIKEFDKFIKRPEAKENEEEEELEEEVRNETNESKAEKKKRNSKKNNKNETKENKNEDKLENTEVNKGDETEKTEIIETDEKGENKEKNKLNEEPKQNNDKVGESDKAEDKKKEIEYDFSDVVSNPENKLLIMKLLIKAADLCECVRKFELADNYKHLLPIEFFMQGDLDSVEGLLYVDNIKERHRLKVKTSVMVFYRQVCLPLFKILGGIFPNISECASQLYENIRRWEMSPPDLDTDVEEEIRAEEEYLKKLEEEKQREIEKQKEIEHQKELEKQKVLEAKKNKLKSANSSTNNSTSNSNTNSQNFQKSNKTDENDSPRETSAFPNNQNENDTNEQNTVQTPVETSENVEKAEEKGPTRVTFSINKEQSNDQPTSAPQPSFQGVASTVSFSDFVPDDPASQEALKGYQKMKEERLAKEREAAEKAATQKAEAEKAEKQETEQIKPENLNVSNLLKAIQEADKENEEKANLAKEIEKTIQIQNQEETQNESENKDENTNQKEKIESNNVTQIESKEKLTEEEEEEYEIIEEEEEEEEEYEYEEEEEEEKTSNKLKSQTSFSDFVPDDPASQEALKGYRKMREERIAKEQAERLAKLQELGKQKSKSKFKGKGNKKGKKLSKSQK